MDQDKTWHGDRPRPSPNFIKWEPSSPPPKGHNPASTKKFGHVCCGQTPGWIKMPLGREVGFDPGHIVLDGDPAPPPPKGHSPPAIFGACLLWRNGWMDQDATSYGGRPHCFRWEPTSPFPTGHSSNFRSMSIVAKRSPISATAEHLLILQ